MVNALREARASARVGDLFGAEIAAAIRTRIASALRAQGCTGPTIGSGKDRAVPRFNQATSSAIPLPPCVAGALPRLPEELEYRSVGATLLLVDAHVSLVVDILEDAFPRTK